MKYLNKSELPKDEKGIINYFIKHKNFLKEFLSLDVATVYEVFFEEPVEHNKDFKKLDIVSIYIFNKLHQQMIFIEYFDVLTMVANTILNFANIDEIIDSMNKLVEKNFSPNILIYPLYGVGFKHDFPLFKKLNNTFKEVTNVNSKIMGVGIYKSSGSIHQFNRVIKDFSSENNIQLYSDFEKFNISNYTYNGLSWLAHNPFLILKVYIRNSESSFSHQDKLIKIINIRQAYLIFYSFLQKKSNLSGTGVALKETKDFKHYLILGKEYERIPFNYKSNELFKNSELLITFSEHELDSIKKVELEKVFNNFEKQFFKYVYSGKSNDFYERYYFRAYESLTFFKRAVNTDIKYSAFEKVVFLSVAFELLLSGEFNKGMKNKLVNRFIKILNLDSNDEETIRFNNLIETRGAFVHNGTKIINSEHQKTVSDLKLNFNSCINSYIKIFMILFEKNLFQKRKNESFDNCVQIMIDTIILSKLNSKP